MRSLIYLLIIVFFVVLAATGCSPPKSTTVRMPSGAVAPAEMDSLFVSIVDSLVSIGEGETQLTCIAEFDTPYSGQPLDGMEALQKLSGEVWILRGAASAIQMFADSPTVLWIGEYKPRYKYNHTLAGASVVWVYVETFHGDYPQFWDEMAAIGITNIRYINIPGYYYAKLTGEQVVELATFWWVKNIYRSHKRAIPW